VRHRPWERELAIREPRTPDEARQRATRGGALVREALAAAREGRPAPDLPAPAAPAASRPAGYELVACAGCYRPINALPGSRCDGCRRPEGSSDA